MQHFFSYICDRGAPAAGVATGEPHAGGGDQHPRERRRGARRRAAEEDQQETESKLT